MSTPLHHEIKDGRVFLRRGAAPVWVYDFANTPKPHVHLFATPAGHVVTLDSPHDHVHHRGLMLAWKVDGVNFWEETGGGSDTAPRGDIAHREWTASEFADGNLRLVEKLDWRTREGGLCLLEEERTLAVSVLENEGSVRCDWQSRFRAPGSKPALLSGKTPHSPISYYGLGMRFARALDHAGRHLDSNGVEDAGEANGKPATWHHYAGVLDETHAKVGVLIVDGKDNPRHPTPWFAISHPPAPFAYVTSSLLLNEDLELPPGDDLTLRYTIHVHDGEWDAARCREVAAL